MKIYFVVMLVLGAFVGSMFLTSLANAQPQCVNGTLKAGVCFPSNTTLSERTVDDVLSTFVGWIAYIFGTIAVIIFIVCGLKYLFSMGDSSSTDAAKSCMKWSIVGVIVAGGSFIVVKFIAMQLLGLAW